MTNPRDKRSYPRIEVILKVEYDSSRDFLADYAYNASGGGLFVATSRTFNVKDKLSFDISFPGLLEPIRCHAEVRWVRSPRDADEDKPAGIGVAFIFESDEQADQMCKLIDHLSLPSNEQTSGRESGTENVFRVLLAEDNPMVREMFRFAVRKFHRSKLSGSKSLTVLEAENGKIAWERIRNGQLDLAIVDYYMPVMDGGQLIRKIRDNQEFRDLPVIVVSVGGDEARKAAYDAGADLYLDKPVLIGHLFESLQRLLEREATRKGT